MKFVQPHARSPVVIAMRLVLFIPLALAGCATPENRVRTALLDAGVAPRVATCMAERMVDRLSIGQLQRLGALGGLKGRRVVDVPISELVRRVRAIGDPEIVEVVTRAGIGCAIAA